MRVEYASSLYSSAMLYICNNFFALWMTYYLFRDRFWTYIVWIFSGFFWTLVYIFDYMDVLYIDAMLESGYWCLHDVWNVISSTCTFTYVAMMNCLFIPCVYMLWNLSLGLKCCTIIHSAKSCPYACIIWTFQICVSLYLVFTLLTFTLLSRKP